MLKMMPDMLSGVRVLDMSRVIAGPYTGMMLADMGADVVKLEVPQHGDDSRYYPPFLNGEAMLYQQFNRNKKSITINLKSEEGIALFKRLIPKFDILIENFRPGVMDKMGIGYEVLEKLNPTLVYGCVSGFGQTGPYAQRPGYDIIGEAMGGLMSTTGWPDGEPTRTGPAMADVLGGLNLAIGILGAYIKRLSSGHGDKVDIALVDSVIASLDVLPQHYFVDGKNPGRNGNVYECAYPYDSFKAKDASFIIAAGNDKLFHIVLDTIGRPDLKCDERYQTNALRVENRVSLKKSIEAWSAQITAEDAVNALLNGGCPASLIYDVEHMAKDPHITDHRKMFVEVESAQAKTMHLTGSVFKFTHGDAGIYRPAPQLGEDTEAVLRAYLQCTDTDIQKWQKEAII